VRRVVLAVSAAFAVLAVFALAALGGLVTWGCSTTTATGPRTTERPNEVAPDGGWASYRPTSAQPYDVDPERAALAMPTSPGAPLGSSLH
jgi:hypothetical protein